MSLRLSPPRRNIRTSVRFDGCTFFSWIFEICLRVCNKSDIWEIFIFLESLNCGWKSVGNCHFAMCVTEVCMLGAFFSCFSCLVLAVLTTRLTDSVHHLLAKKTLAVATLVITIAGPLRKDTLDCRRISSRSSCAS